MMRAEHLQRARMVADLGHVYGVKRVDVARWIATPAGLSATQVERLTLLGRAFDASGERTGGEPTCEALRLLRLGQKPSLPRIELTSSCTAAVERAPRGPFPDDAFLRCDRCGWMVPLENTPDDERCGECGGEYTVTTDGSPSTPEQLAVRAAARDRNEQMRMRPDTAECPRCRQLMIARDTICGACRELDRAPQGDAMTLFDMAPALRAPQPEGLF